MSEMTVAWFKENKPASIEATDTSLFEELLESYEARMPEIEKVLEDPKAAGGKKIKKLSMNLSRITTRMAAEIRRMKGVDEDFTQVLESWESSIEGLEGSMKDAMKNAR